jgi:formylmethanofuran dehydrogenase subunit E
MRLRRLRRPEWQPIAPVVELDWHRHGVIRHRRCVECGELVEEHRMIRIGDAWFCLDVTACQIGGTG